MNCFWEAGLGELAIKIRPEESFCPCGIFAGPKGLSGATSGTGGLGSYHRTFGSGEFSEGSIWTWYAGIRKSSDCRRISSARMAQAAMPCRTNESAKAKRRGGAGMNSGGCQESGRLGTKEKHASWLAYQEACCVSKKSKPSVAD